MQLKSHSCYKRNLKESNSKARNCLIKILPKPHFFFFGGGKKVNKAQCLLIFCKKGESNQYSHFMNSAL